MSSSSSSSASSPTNNIMTSTGDIDIETVLAGVDIDGAVVTAAATQQRGTTWTWNRYAIAAAALLAAIGAAASAVAFSISSSRTASVSTAQLQQSQVMKPTKSPKSPPRTTITECDDGTVYTEDVTLSMDLVCEEFSGLCGIKVSGEGNTLYCGKKSSLSSSVTDNGDYGICLSDGAIAVGCDVQGFGVGIYVDNGGEVKKSKVSGNNYYGILASGTGTTTISDT
jgi:hypothetical protein